MTDWAVQSVIFMSKTTQKLPEIERTAQIARFSQCSMHPRDGGN